MAQPGASSRNLCRKVNYVWLYFNKVCMSRKLSCFNIQRMSFTHTHRMKQASTFNRRTYLKCAREGQIDQGPGKLCYNSVRRLTNLFKLSVATKITVSFPSNTLSVSSLLCPVHYITPGQYDQCVHTNLPFVFVFLEHTSGTYLYCFGRIQKYLLRI